MEKQSQNYTILILEDEKQLLFAIQEKLHKNGFKTVVAQSVQEAVKHLENKEKIDAIWVDHYLIGAENGFSFVKKLKEYENYKNTPVFVVSNTVSSDKIKDYFDLGIQKYYVKAEHGLEKIINDIKVFLEKK